MSETPENRLAALGINLPVPAVPVANYVSWVRSGNLITVSGQLPLRDGKLVATGKLGGSVDEETGALAARFCMINLIAQIKAAVGDLGKVTKVVRLGGFIACEPSFTKHSSVMHSSSDLSVAFFGDAGRHARSPVRLPSLPLYAAFPFVGLFEFL
mgnify:CR=1 FL=1